MMQHVMRVKQAAELLHRKISNLIAGGKVQYIKIVKGIQLSQLTLLSGETATDLQHPQEFGFTSKAKSGASGLALFKGGNRDNGIVVTIYDRRYFPADLSNGDSCQYDAEDNRVWLKGTAGILIQHGENTITLDADGITLKSAPGKNIILDGNVIGMVNITAMGTVGDASGTMSEMRTVYNSHDHDDPQGGQTGLPNQLMS